MKKINLLAASAVLFSLGACSSDPGDNVRGVSYPVYSLVTDCQNGETTPVVSYYTFDFNFTKEKVKVLGALRLGETVHTFQSEDSDFTNNTYEGGQIISINNITADWDMDSEKPITNFRCNISSMTNDFKEVVTGVPELTDEQKSTLYYPATLVSYGVGTDYIVSTFPIVAWYEGSTSTSYTMAGEDKNFTDKGITYRISIDVAKKTANVIMYNARFADGMPALPAIVLQDLPVEFANATYTIKATDIIPMVAESGLTEYPNYKFNEFSFAATGLTQAIISFKVAGAFNGSFQGNWVNTVKS